MKKVKIMSSCYEHALEEEVNAFIRNKIVTDIQFRPTSRSSITSFVVMIVYEGGIDDYD